MPDPTPREIKEKIAYLEKTGAIDPECAYCQKYYYPRLNEDGELAFGPAHKAMSNCRSGERNHCTCDGCF